MFNFEFAQKDVHFRAACDAVGISATRRQAGKWRRQTGIAYLHGRGGAVKRPQEDLSSLTCKALRQRCADRGIQVASKARKADLIAALGAA